MNVSSSVQRQIHHSRYPRIFVALKSGKAVRAHYQGQKYRYFPTSKAGRTPLSEAQLQRQASLKAQKGHYSEALALLSQLIEQSPATAKYYNNRGLVYFYSGQPQKAQADYNRAIALDPQLTEAYNNRANYSVSIGHLQEALADYDRAIDLNPFNIRAWINRGITHRNLGQYDRSLDDLDFALRLGRLTGHIYAERGRTYYRMGDWNCAVADYQRALKQFSSLASLCSPADRRQHLRVKTWLNELYQAC
ncbi:MAG: tetratricopeptide repeat protein [Desertifilum sp. SIO1I2]|nr:tetratricopeptide repeat protein [Desertifilum sp. SIO1I2]